MKNKKLITIGLVTTLALTLVACSGDNKTNNVSNNSSNTNVENNVVEQSSEKEIYFDGKIAEINDVKIEITDYKIIPVGEKGNEYGENPVIAFWYKATNKTDKDIDPNTAWIVIFTAIQDNDPNMINKLNVGSLPDDKFLDTQMNTIKKDGTVENAVSYELSDLETPVTLIAQQGIGGDEIGRFDFNIK